MGYLCLLWSVLKNFACCSPAKKGRYGHQGVFSGRALWLRRIDRLGPLRTWRVSAELQSLAVRPRHGGEGKPPGISGRYAVIPTRRYDLVLEFQRISHVMARGGRRHVRKQGRKACHEEGEGGARDILPQVSRALFGPDRAAGAQMAAGPRKIDLVDFQDISVDMDLRAFPTIALEPGGVERGIGSFLEFGGPLLHPLCKRPPC